jgi:predicted transport protein
MSDIKLFQISNCGVLELSGKSVALEKSLQELLERNLETFLGVRCLDSEYTTGKTHGGRIDTLGIDENGCPVIIEYKRSTNENVINQGLFYLDWLMDHKAEFKLLVLEKFGKEASDSIEWSTPRLLCIAGDFTKYDEHAVQQINRNIELIRYRKYGGELLLLELVNATTAKVENLKVVEVSNVNKSANKGQKTVTELLVQASLQLKDIFEGLTAYLLAMGDDVQQKTLKFYFAFKRLKNFASVEIRPQAQAIVVYVKVDPASVDLNANQGFLRDVSNIGHFGTGDLEITIRSAEDLERAKEYLNRSYEAS